MSESIFTKVLFSCGHDEMREIHGKTVEECEATVKQFESNGLCSRCERQDHLDKAGSVSVAKEMKYSEYRDKYTRFPIKKDSYNPKRKTVTVLIPDRFIDNSLPAELKEKEPEEKPEKTSDLDAALLKSRR